MRDELVQNELLEGLIGVRSSRRTYYSEYREQERRLERAIAAIANISGALCNTTRGVPPLAQAVVRVAAQHFAASWAVLALNTTPGQRWAARCLPNGEVVLADDAVVPPALVAAIEQVQDRQELPPNDAQHWRMLGAPMLLRDTVVGALVVVPGGEVALDARETSVLQTLANQAAVAVENARLYAQTAVLYEEACHQKSELEHKNRQLEKARRWLAAARQNEVIHHERSRIARELHDSVAQYLICIGMNLEWCRAQLPEHSSLYERILSAKELARSAVTRMRGAIFELSAIDERQSSLAAALQELILDFERASQLRVRLQIGDKPRPLSAEIEHALYQIAQEALFNVYKHAQAATATVELRFVARAVQLTVSDDGVGLPRQLSGIDAQALAVSSCGLRNMQSRARELNGTCVITRRRKGTKVRVVLPTPQ